MSHEERDIIVNCIEYYCKKAAWEVPTVTGASVQEALGYAEILRRV